MQGGYLLKGFCRQRTWRPWLTGAYRESNSPAPCGRCKYSSAVKYGATVRNRRDSQPDYRLDPLVIRGAYIGGLWIDTKEKFSVIDPGNGQMIGQVSCCSVTDVKTAVDQAKLAHRTWKHTSVLHRHKVLMEWFDLTLKNQGTLAELLSRESGKPIREAMAEVEYGASFLQWFAEEARRNYGDVIPSPHSAAHHVQIIREPVGVAGLITPWNFPIAMVTRKAAAALACGCTVVLKPAEDTPYSALALAKLAEAAGVPPGVFNVVPCDREHVQTVGNELATNPDVAKISLTGSTAVGKSVMKLSADTIKRLSLELGGNAPFIVFEDADLDNAVEHAVRCKFRAAGQTCVCANRFFIHKKVYDVFASKLSEKVAQLKVGYGGDPTTDIGPMINSRALTRISHMVNDALEKGAQLVVGVREPVGLEGRAKGGTYFAPTVLDCRNLDSSASIVTEEIFGPVAALYAFESEDEVVASANSVKTGLAGYVFTEGLRRGHRVCRKLELGLIGLNTGILSSCEIPFGGIKESGMGREGSRFGMDEFLYYKTIATAPL